MPHPNRRNRVAQLEKLAVRLDAKFKVFGIPIGWDSILGLIPGAGAAITALPTAAMMAEAVRLGARKRVLARMVWNGGIDLTLGAIPLLGDIFDLFFKSHQRNARLLRAEADRLDDERRPPPDNDLVRRPRRSTPRTPPLSREVSKSKRSLK